MWYFLFLPFPCRSTVYSFWLILPTFVLSFIGTFSQQELNSGAHINHEPDTHDIMINIQSWGWRDGCFLDSQLGPHTGVSARKGWYYAMSLHNLGHLYIFWPYTEDVCNGPSITRPPTNLVVPITGALTAYKGIEGRACTIRRSGWKDLSMYSVV